MHKNLEEAFDANAFVIAPAAVPEKNQPVEWKIVLTKKFAKLTIFDNTSYGDMFPRPSDLNNTVKKALTLYKE
ncbi:hypothetical protein NA56DRAFT_699280 [Hyaloscypha hepaticicola]|uniref:Uncharacterized protein n=1 Tax=Hyaloscypha hepaticicola TaxID=2082293 RepID=A0A2J6QGF9_9HELO|nr:hypothetical protein NA56DRAFT_699280 [Hyaloscypha hepaticicola]